MKRKDPLLDRTLVVTTLLCLLPLVFTSLVYDQLPQQMAIHFDLRGNPDSYASKAFATIALPLLLAILNIVMQIALKTDPKRDPQEKIYLLSRWALPVISSIINPLVLLFSLGIPVRIEKIVPLMVSLFFLVIGNYLPKCKQNYTIGIKLPWTLASETNWKKTHRFAGWVWTGASIVLIVLVLLDRFAAYSFFAIVIVMIVIPPLYSFLLSRKEDPTDTE